MPLFKCALAVLLLVAATSQAQAYIDPGAGSMMVQGAIASVTGGFFAFKTCWRRLRGWLAARKKHLEP